MCLGIRWVQVGEGEEVSERERQRRGGGGETEREMNTEQFVKITTVRMYVT